MANLPRSGESRRRLGNTDCCPLCARTTVLTFHHLIPKKMHRRPHFRKHYSREELSKGVYICRQCHNGVHRLFDEMQLAKQFYSLELLLASEALQKHCRWVGRQKVGLEP